MTLLLLCSIVMAVLAATIYWTPVPWTDNTDCSRIIQHSVRVLSPCERHAMWEMRYSLFHEHGDKFYERLPLKPPH